MRRENKNVDAVLPPQVDIAGFRNSKTNAELAGVFNGFVPGNICFRKLATRASVERSLHDFQQALETEAGHYHKAEQMLKEACAAIPEFGFYEQLASR